MWFWGFPPWKKWILPIIKAKKFILAKLEQPITQQDRCKKQFTYSNGCCSLGWGESEKRQSLLGGMHASWDHSKINIYIYIYIRAHIFKNKHAHSIELIITILSDLCSIQTRSTLEHIKPMFATNTPKKYQILWPSCDLLSSSSQAHLCRKYHPIEARKTLYTTWFILFRQYSPL